MPTYEYRCPEGHLFDVFKSINAPAPEVCPVCGKSPVTVVLHPVAVHFKGSGFYSTDYGRGSKKASTDAKTDSGGEKTPEKKKAAEA